MGPLFLETNAVVRYNEYGIIWKRDDPVKKYISLLLSLCICASFTACSQNQAASESSSTAAVSEPVSSSVVSSMPEVSQPASSSESAASSVPLPDKAEEPKELVYPWNLTNAPMDTEHTYPYKTVCYQDPSLETVGYVSVYDYAVTPSDDPLYVEKALKARFVFSDDNAWNYGMKTNLIFGETYGDGTYTDGGDEWMIEVDGEEYPLTVLKDEFVSSGWTPWGVFVSEYELTVRMHKDFDDMAVVFYNSANHLKHADEEGNLLEGTPYTEILDEDSQWFLMGGESEDGTLTYYGEPYDTMQNNIDPLRVMDGFTGEDAYYLPEDEVPVTSQEADTPVESPEEPAEVVDGIGEMYAESINGTTQMLFTDISSSSLEVGTEKDYVLTIHYEDVPANSHLIVSSHTSDGSELFDYYDDMCSGSGTVERVFRLDGAWAPDGMIVLDGILCDEDYNDLAYCTLLLFAE